MTRTFSIERAPTIQKAKHNITRGGVANAKRVEGPAGRGGRRRGGHAVKRRSILLGLGNCRGHKSAGRRRTRRGSNNCFREVVTLCTTTNARSRANVLKYTHSLRLGKRCLAPAEREKTRTRIYTQHKHNCTVLYSCHTTETQTQTQTQTILSGVLKRPTNHETKIPTMPFYFLTPRQANVSVQVQQQSI